MTFSIWLARSLTRGIERHINQSREDGKDACRGHRIHEIPARLAHQADRVDAPKGGEAEHQACRADNPRPGSSQLKVSTGGLELLPLLSPVYGRKTGARSRGRHAESPERVDAFSPNLPRSRSRCRRGGNAPHWRYSVVPNKEDDIFPRSGRASLVPGQADKPILVEDDVGGAARSVISDIFSAPSMWIVFSAASSRPGRYRGALRSGSGQLVACPRNFPGSPTDLLNHVLPSFGIFHIVLGRETGGVGDGHQHATGRAGGRKGIDMVCRHCRMRPLIDYYRTSVT